MVDDDAVAGQALVKILDKIGCEPSFCESAAEALELHADEPEMFDLMITDLNMPDVSGLELAQKLRERGFAKPIVLVSGRPQDAPAEERARLGIDLVLNKPFALREVAGIVWSAVGKARAAMAARPRVEDPPSVA